MKKRHTASVSGSREEAFGSGGNALSEYAWRDRVNGRAPVPPPGRDVASGARMVAIVVERTQTTVVFVAVENATLGEAISYAPRWVDEHPEVVEGVVWSEPTLASRYGVVPESDLHIEPAARFDMRVFFAVLRGRFRAMRKRNTGMESYFGRQETSHG